MFNAKHLCTVNGLKALTLTYSVRGTFKCYAHADDLVGGCTSGEFNRTPEKAIATAMKAVAIERANAMAPA